MGGKKKNRNEDQSLKILILVTAILNLVRTLMDIIKNLTG